MSLAIAEVGGGALGCAIAFVAAGVMRSVDEPGLRLMMSLALVTATYRLADLDGRVGPNSRGCVWSCAAYAGSTRR
jgi:NhaP-type Na+/H+ or K+/H+ antiporter